MTLPDSNTKRTAIIGCGLIGRAWAIAFARGGCEVRLYDPAPSVADGAIGLIAPVLDELAATGLLGGQTSQAVHARITAAPGLEEALDGALHVQENSPENVETKKALFSKLDALARPDAVLASSTSAILPSLFTAHLEHRERCIVVHPLNPPHLIPAAEVVPAPWTSAATVARVRDFMLSIGQKPIVMMKEIDGFLMNRLQGALLEECFRLLEGGYAGVEDIDAALKDGLALRWSFIGPFETMDLNAPGGIRDYVARYQPSYARLYESTKWRADWLGPALETAEAQRRAKVPDAEIAARQRWRDRRLMALAAHKRAAARDIGD